MGNNAKEPGFLYRSPRVSGLGWGLGFRVDGVRHPSTPQ